MEMDERIRLFKEPDASFRGKPFWAWNGRLEEEHLLDQIDAMKEMGFGGYFMHSRTGLETEYLGEEWFELINSCSDYGCSQGMESWLYDEDRWPSGIAGGLVTCKEEMRASFLKVEEYGQGEESCVKWDLSVQAAFLCSREGRYVSYVVPFDQGMEVPEGKRLLVFRVEQAPLNEVYNGYTYVDTMNLAATEYFLQKTHEKYSSKCGDRVGGAIKGIFTDEPHRGPLFSVFSDGGEDRVPYTPKLWQEFEERFGYDLRGRLPELFFRLPGQELSKVARDYIECCQELFLENFAVPMEKWCQENHMIFTGHVLHEDSLTAQTVMQGSLMRFYAHMDYPGVDVLGRDNRCFWIVKQVASVARQQGKPWILSELYGCSGWQMSFADYKNLGLWQALLGVNLRCPHLSWYTMKGEAKRDYPASIFYQSAWSGEYKYVEDFFSRIHVFLHEGQPECELLVLCPLESVWSRAYSGAFAGLDARDPGIRKLEQEYVLVFDSLMKARIDFDYGEESLIWKWGSVKEGRLTVGCGTYKKVLVAGMDTIRGTTLELLEQFAADGGEVIFAGPVPEYVDVVPSGRAKALALGSLCVELEESALVKACASGREVAVAGEAGGYIYAQVKRCGQKRRIMLLNTDWKRDFSQVEVCLGEGVRVELWDAATGDRTVPCYEVRDGKICVKVDFARGQERLYVLSGEMEEDRTDLAWKNTDGDRKHEISAGKNEACETDTLQDVELPAGKLPERYGYELSEHNVCVLDRVSLRVIEAEGAEKKDKEKKDIEKKDTEAVYDVLEEKGTQCVIRDMEVLKADRLFRESCNVPARSGSMLQPWYRLTREGGNQRLGIVELEYQVEVQQVPDHAWLVLEDREHVRKVQINGRTIALQEDGKWVDICFTRLLLPAGSLEQGRNHIVILYDYDMNCGIEAIYLLGDFGVALTEDGRMPSLTRLPERVCLGDLGTQGFPFYSGAVKYLLPEGWLAEQGLEGRKVTVKAGNFSGTCLKLLGDERKMIAWAPFQESVVNLRAFELVLTRRNTFGPLHQIPVIAGAYGPENFLTEGARWSDAFMLLPQGIFSIGS